MREGFARTGYLIPVRDGMGVGPGWEILPPPNKGPQMGVFRYTQVSIVVGNIL